MYVATPKEQSMYEEVYHLVRDLKRGEEVKWRNTTIEFMKDIGNKPYKMTSPKGVFYHWSWHMVAVTVISITEGLSLGVVKEPN